ncbi:hypothetical protein Rcae01_06568 [Novipirellula caenicola]|uniref:Cadherin domain-containing protein n=1 Tax=Novipirellula caenicola TaxID=1536901 RepID=A0ABP9W3G7_9BACT
MATVEISVTAVNDTPVANDDAFTTNEDVQLSNSVAGNDSDVDGPSASYSVTTGPTNGTLVFNSDGTFTYTPNANYTGSDTFTYERSDGAAADSAVVNITVTSVNDAPVAKDYVAPLAPLHEDTTTTGLNFGMIPTELVTDVDDAPATFEADHFTITGVSIDGGPAISPAAAGISVDGSGDITIDTTVGAYQGLAAGEIVNVVVTFVVEDAAGLSDTGTVTFQVTGANDAPVAVGDAALSTPEDTTLTINPALLLANDSDIDGDTLSITGVSADNGATAAIVAGNIVVTPAANSTVPITLTYTLSDGTTTSSATVTINVTAVNDAPTVDQGIATQTATEGVSFSVAVPIDAFADVDGGPLTYTATGLPSWMSFDGTTFTGMPANGDVGGTITVTANDGNGGTVSTSFLLSVTPVNDAPVANAQSVTTAEDTAKVIVLGASDIDGDTLTYSIVSGPTNGTVTIAGNVATYTPNANYFGSDSFSFKVNDGTVDSADAVVSIEVTPVNDAPVAEEDAITTTEDTTFPASGTFNVLANDTDAEDGTPTTVSKVNGSATNFGMATTTIGGGSVTISATGVLTYVPKANFHGVDQVTYTTIDAGGLTSQAVVYITVTSVNDAPVVNPVDLGTINEGSTRIFTATQLLANSSDVDADTLAVSNVTVSAAEGTISGSGPWTFTPAASFTGPVTINFNVTDGVIPSPISTTASLVVNAINHNPAAVDDLFTSAVEDTPLTGNVLADNGSGADSDPDGNTITSTLVPGSGPQHGSVILAGNGDFTYTPNANFHGTDSFTYILSDGQGGTDTAVVSITVAAVNDAPVAVNDHISTTQDIPVDFNAFGNDTDVDGDMLTITEIESTTISEAGNAFILGGEVQYDPNGMITFVPTPGFVGVTSFTYTAADPSGAASTATVTISVVGAGAVNQLPVAVNDTFTTAEDTVLTGNLLDANPTTADSDPDGDTLTTALLSTPSKGSVTILANGDFTYTPFANQNGSDSFTYRLSDGRGGNATGTVNITIDPVNDAPVAIDAVFGVAENAMNGDSVDFYFSQATDIDGDDLLFSISDGDTNPANDVFAIDASTGEITVLNGSLLDYETQATYDLTVTVTDNASPTPASTTATVRINVSDINEVPVANDDTVNGINTAVHAFDVRVNDFDVDGDNLTVTMINGASVTFPASIPLPGVGTLDLVGPGNFNFTPNAGYTGSSTFTYTVSDGTLIDTATVTLNITSGNTAPVANTDSYTVNEDGVLIANDPDGTLTPGNPGDNGVLFNDIDADGDTLTPVLLTPPSNGTALLLADGRLTYTPNANFVGTDSLTYRLLDGRGGSAIGTVNFTVVETNDAPQVTASTFSIAENSVGGTVVGTVLVTDIDSPPQNLSYTLIGADAALFEIDSVGQIKVAAGVIAGDLNFEIKPKYEFEVMVTDDGSNPGPLSTTQSVKVTLTDVAEAGPTVTGVYVRSTAWHPELADILDDGNFNNNTDRGYVVPMDSDQLMPLPWINLNEVVLRFDADVSASISVNDFRVSGIAGVRTDETPGVIPQIESVSASGTIVRVRLNQALDASQFTITAVSTGITDAQGNTLDGEWTQASAGQLVSGNGVAGGDFSFRLNILPGDVNQDGIVNSTDSDSISGFSYSFGNTNYSIFRDVNGDAKQDTTDKTRILEREGSKLF